MHDRDLIEILDATLPRLELYPGCVPAAGRRELREYQDRYEERVAELAIFGSSTVLLAFMTWFAWMPWTPLWIIASFSALTGVTAMRSVELFLKLAFEPRVEQALPSGTDMKTAQLEDGSLRLIRGWNPDASRWNECVETLRLEISDWQLLKNVPEARGVEWTELGSLMRFEGLVAAMRSLFYEREALVARKEEIDHRLLHLETRMRRLRAAEEAPMLALPAPTDDSDDD